MNLSLDPFNKSSLGEFAFKWSFFTIINGVSGGSTINIYNVWTAMFNWKAVFGDEVSNLRLNKNGDRFAKRF